MRQLIAFITGKASKRGKPRPRVKPVWRQPVALMGVMMLLAVGAGSGSWWIWNQGWIQDTALRAKWAMLAGSGESGLSVREIFVEGRVETDKDQLLNALRLKRGAPILTFDPHAARRRVESLPWIRTAVIERQLPDVIHMRIVERRPLAIWQNNSRFMLIDTEGKPIPIRHIGRFSNLIIVVGQEAPRHASGLLDILATETELAKRVKAAVWIGNRRWDLHFDNNVSAKLPERDAVQAWVQLADMQRKHKVLDNDIAGVDLRLPDRLIIRRVPGGDKDVIPVLPKFPERAKPGHET